MSYFPYIISALALLFSCYQFVRATSKEDSSQMAKVLAKLETISETINEIKIDVRDTKADMQDLRERVALTEASVKSAHKRLDAIEKGAER